MPFRLAVTADLHYDVPRSRAPAQQIIAEINAAEVDGVLLVGDSATAVGEGLEQCLALFRRDRPGWFVPGNHELWTKLQPRDAEYLLAEELPARVSQAGWSWLPGAPARLGNATLIGSPGWYDYAFAEGRLGIPRRFYEAKVSPAAARTLRRQDLDPLAPDVSPAARDFLARWNDGRFIHGIGSDAAFLDRRLAELLCDLAAAGPGPIVAAVHVAPHETLLPKVPQTGAVPPDRYALAFTRAYLGSPAIGELLLAHENVSVVVCGHTHVPREAVVEGRRFLNIGSTYTTKRFEILEL